jgi:hypothetical protein
MASFLDTIDFRYGGTVVDDVATKKTGKKKAGRLRDPLNLLTTLSGMVLYLLVGGFLLTVCLTPFGKGSIFGYGHDVVACAATGDMGMNSGNGNWLVRPHAGVTVTPTHINLCTQSPSSEQRWWYTLENLPGVVTLITVALVTYLVLQHARGQGPYSSGFAARLRFLGWFLLADSVLRPAIETYASHKLWASLADGPIDHPWRPAWTALFAGIALLSLAQILAVGTAMREDLEGVV